MTDPSPSLATPYRTHTAGQLRASDAGTPARLAGWVHRRRDHGQLIFLDLRDRHGITQVVIDQTDAPAAHEVAEPGPPRVRRRGRGRRRAAPARDREPEAADRRDRAPGDAGRRSCPRRRRRRSTSTSPTRRSTRALRLKYRYLDIRRQPMADRLLLRSRMVQAIREVHHAQRLRRGRDADAHQEHARGRPRLHRPVAASSRARVYALPQSPQQLKQLLMVAGIDRYFQIARCYRDEDLRGDRQPEFTQLDLEMSFVDEATVMGFVEAMAIEVSRATVPGPADPAGPVPALHLRRGHGAVRLRQAGPAVRDGARRPRAAPRRRRTARRRPGSASSTTRSPPAAGSRHRRAGHGRRHPPRDRRADRAREAVRRPGAGLPGPRAGRRDQGPDRQVPVRTTPTRALIERERGGRGRPHPHRRRPPRRRRPTSSGGCGSSWATASGSPTRTSSPTCWVNRFPMYQWDAEASAGTRPTTRSAAWCPRTRRCS